MSHGILGGIDGVKLPIRVIAVEFVHSFRTRRRF